MEPADSVSCSLDLLDSIVLFVLQVPVQYLESRLIVNMVAA